VTREPEERYLPTFDYGWGEGYDKRSVLTLRARLATIPTLASSEWFFSRVARACACTTIMVCLSALAVIGFQTIAVREVHAWPDNGNVPNVLPPTPTATAAPTPKRYNSREELLRDTDKYAIEKLGFEDENKTGIPDYREVYVVNVHDCTTVSAEFDYIVDQMGKARVMSPAQAAGTVQIRGGNHAANMVPGIGVVDLTPMGTGNGYMASQGMPWCPFDSTGYTEYPVGVPRWG
jgi:hypothetical protein